MSKYYIDGLGYFDNQCGNGEVREEKPPISDRGVTLWSELKDCRTFYPSCCDVLKREWQNEMWLGDDGAALFFYGLETYEIATRILDGYIFDDICIFCLNEVMGGYNEPS